ncbi:hypothetical protein [Nonomuraea guangzhouensis]|uniref:Helix-turn-helix domain-containing protein n=1 Tax=Nonomuraea guangzhouensis TaxID=1291555 RepID=A0ABW4G2L4_9ACTN|nr:hypothetical protein [Nonomuraea guangzhouensis]
MAAMNRKVGRPQGAPRGSTQQANTLAEFLLTLTAGMTVRELAARYHVGKTLWSEYRSGLKIIPLELLTRLVQDQHEPDERIRHGHMETAARLHTAALEATHREPVPVAPPPLPSPTAATVTEAAVMEPAASPEPPAARRHRPRPLFLVGGGTAIAVLTVLALLLGWGSSSGDAVFAVGPGGHGIFRWDGADAAGWTRIGDGAKRLHSGPAGLFATGTDDRLYRYEGRPGRWSLISEAGGDFAVSGAHVFRLAADHQSVAVWNGHGTSWTTIGGPAVRLYGGEPGLFATSPEAGWIFRYAGRPFSWDRVGTAGASFALTDRHLYGLTPERALVNRWLSDDPSAPWPSWTYAAGPAAELYGGPAGLFSTDPTGARLRVLTDSTTGLADQIWQDIGPAGAEVAVGREAVFVLTEDRSRILRWSADSGTWQHIGGPAQTVTAG